MKTTDNPPAFPYVEPPTTCNVNEGMTLRDYFAGQAIAGFCSNGNLVELAKLRAEMGGPVVRDSLASKAYEYADAMLAARATPTA